MEVMLSDYLKGFRENRIASLLLQAVELMEITSELLGKWLNYVVQTLFVL
jgi:hypothetical protein